MHSDLRLNLLRSWSSILVFLILELSRDINCEFQKHNSLIKLVSFLRWFNEGGIISIWDIILPKYGKNVFINLGRGQCQKNISYFERKLCHKIFHTMQHIISLGTLSACVYLCAFVALWFVLGLCVCVVVCLCGCVGVCLCVCVCGCGCVCVSVYGVVAFLHIKWYTSSCKWRKICLVPDKAVRAWAALVEC